MPSGMPAHVPLKVTSEFLRGEQRRRGTNHGEPEMSILEVPYKDLFLATMENLNMKKHKCEWKNVKGEWDQWGRGKKEIFLKFCFIDIYLISIFKCIEVYLI